MDATLASRAAELRAWIIGNPLSPRQIATRAGLAKNALVRACRDDWNPTLETLTKVEALRARLDSDRRDAA